MMTDDRTRTEVMRDTAYKARVTGEVQSDQYGTCSPGISDADLDRLDERADPNNPA